MDKNDDKDWENFSKELEIKKKLIDASTYLTFYEILKATIINKIEEFFHDGLNNGKFIISEDYKKEILNRKFYGKKNIFISSCKWLIKNGVISQDEYNLIKRIKDHRNILAHDLPQFLFNREFIIDYDLLNQIKILTLKITKWWIVNVEIPTKLGCNDQEIDASKIMTKQEFMLNYIFNVANTDFYEIKSAIKKLKFK